MKLNLKYTALKVDEIEKAKGKAIELCIDDTRIDNMCLFVQKGLVDDNGKHGVTRNVALSKIDEYLQEYDKQELLLDIMEALVAGGFLPKSVNVKDMRKKVNTYIKKVTQIDNSSDSETNGEL